MPIDLSTPPKKMLTDQLKLSMYKIYITYTQNLKIFLISYNNV